MKASTKLNAHEKSAMKRVGNGADVYDPGLARTLRLVEKNHPELVTIGDAMRAPEDGAQVQPYFGARLTQKGMEAIQ